MTTIGSNAFSRRASLTSVTIPDSVITIGEYAFCACTSLANIDVADENTSCRDIDGVLFDKDVTRLIQYPAGKSDTSYDIPDSLIEIGRSAFENCDSLASVTIPDGVTSIEKEAFYDCDSLASITIPDSVTTLGDYVFRACTKLTSIDVLEGNKSYCDIDGVLFNKSVTKLIRYPAGKSDTTYSVPDGVTSICDDAFRHCTNLGEVREDKGGETGRRVPYTSPEEAKAKKFQKAKLLN